MTSFSKATAYAHTNIALVKYWGKRAGERALNLPAVGSLSLTLQQFGTETTVELSDDADDTFTLNGATAGAEETKKVSLFLNLVRALAHNEMQPARVTSRNDVPTAAGLASSASAFAALALAATKAYDVRFDDKRLSQLARQGSGSAARSIFGGFVLLERGEAADGSDCFARPLSTSLDVRLVVARCAKGPKETGSTVGMDHTAQTSPYYRAWVETHAQDLHDAQAALAEKNLEKLGEVMEHSTLKMHATTLAARPGFFYFAPVTIAVLQAVRALRGQGTGAWATMDAGPHVKVLCAPADAEQIAARLREVDGVIGVDVASPGPAARLLS